MSTLKKKVSKPIRTGNAPGYLKFLAGLPVMHDATTTLKKHLEADGKSHTDKKGYGADALRNPVICERETLENLAGDVQVLNLRVAGYEETQRGFDTMKEDVDEIAAFFRDAFAREISLGHHSSRKLGVIVTGYLRDYLSLKERDAIKQ
jgi:hypothetical protein